MKTTIKTLSFLFLTIALTVGCAQRGDDVGGDDEPGADAGNGGDLTIDPPAESGTWACRSGVDAEGTTYLEFRPGYLNQGTVQTAYIVGEADDEGIYAYFHGAYTQQSKHAVSGWYRLPLTGPKGSVGILTYASCVDLVGDKSQCWAQYGGSLSTAARGPFGWNSSGDDYACRYEIGEEGQPAIPRGAN